MADEPRFSREEDVPPSWPVWVSAIGADHGSGKVYIEFVDAADKDLRLAVAVTPANARRLLAVLPKALQALDGSTN